MNAEADPISIHTPQAVRAATTIQAGFRGYRVRKQQHIRSHQKEPHRGTEYYGGDHIQQTSTLDPVVAATRIQASYRGYRTRHALHDKQKPDALINPYSAVTVRERTEADKAAAKIQASFRGYMTRRQLAEYRAEQAIKTGGNKYHDRSYDSDTNQKAPLRTRDQNKYSTRQEGAYTAFKSIDPTQLNNAATVIQAGFRGYHTRKALHKGVNYPQSPETQGKENAEQAATRIQATYRGFMTRKKLKRGEDDRTISKSRMTESSQQ